VPKPEVLVDYYRSLVERCDGYEIGADPDAMVTADDMPEPTQPLLSPPKEGEQQMDKHGASEAPIAK